MFILDDPKTTPGQSSSEGSSQGLAAMNPAKDVCAAGRLHLPVSGPQTVTGAGGAVVERLRPTQPVFDTPLTQPEAHR